MKSSDQAFPTFYAQTGVTYLGMTLKDYLIAHILPALLAGNVQVAIQQEISRIGYVAVAASLADEVINETHKEN